MTSLRRQLADSLVLARRNLEHIRQIPEKLMDVTLQPLMFVLLFGYVFGGVIAVPGGHYREYLIGGVLVQTIAFGMIGPATALATDLTEGVVDRFRSLPIAPSSFLLGHMLAALLATALGIVVLSLGGLLVGWHIHASPVQAAGGYGLLLLFAFTMLWVGAFVGVSVRSPDAVQGIAFLLVFPLTFMASTFVPIAGLGGALRDIADYNPISTLAVATRTLFGNPTALPAHESWPLAHPVVASVAWCLLLMLAAIPLTARRYAAKTAD